ncbi:bifunctional diguanylate cyclase/phosphodiesterase [Acidocella sp.]|uniref:putative bifunctional diguanylate cyclase/phosphodiesterase n=1 Tax=Acidocella sp. TaxID=50710 RepID=UPI002620F9A3|nr:EAL domain-containing protein [Acidocella sp.]
MPSPDNAGHNPPNSTLLLLVCRDQLYALRSNMLAAIPVNLVIAAIALFVSVHDHRGKEGAAWFIAVGTVNTLRMGQAWPAVMRRKPEASALSFAGAQGALNRLCLTALLSGVVWALVPVLCDAFTSPHTLFYLTIICGITAGAVTHGTPFALMPSCFIVPPLLSVFVCLLYAGGFDRNCLALTVLIYAAALLRFAWQSEAAFRASSLLKNEARVLADSLEQERLKAVSVAQQMNHRAMHDDLTGLFNRPGFLREISRCIRAARGPFCLMLLDLDGFKSINGTFGHHTGDRVLIEVARRLSQVLDNTVTTARIGADEFAIFFTVCATCEPATELATRLIATSAMPLASLDAGRLGACIGIYTGDACNVAELLTYATEALRAAKSTGRNQFQVFDERLNARLKMRRDIERHLGRALDTAELEVYYQPIFSHGGLTLAGLEALLRWQHPQHGMVPPQEIVATAALTGLAEPLLRFILSNVCKTIQELRARGLAQLRVAVNISPREISHLAVDEILFSELNKHGCPTAMLEVEVTEETALDIRSVQDKLIRLTEGGVQIAIDDFGVGYSTLATLRQSYIKKIKIDQSFIKDIAKSHDSQLLVQSVLNLGKSLGIQVVAEGVETKDDMDCLRRQGCSLMQGHLFLPPVSLTALLERLALNEG